MNDTDETTSIFSVHGPVDELELDEELQQHLMDRGFYPKHNVALTEIIEVHSRPFSWKFMKIKMGPALRKKQWLGILMMVLVPLWLAACVSTPDGSGQKANAQKKFDEALQAKSLNQPAEEIAKLKEAVALDPREPFYHMVLGDVYFSQAALDEAEQAYLEAIRADPKFFSPYRSLGRLYMQKRQWDDALFYLKRALDAPNVENPHQVFNWIGVSHLAKGELNLAEKTWKQALDIKENSQIRLNLALAYKEGERFDLARESLTKALAMDPKMSRAHYELAQLQLKARKFKQAKHHFNQVLTLEPLGRQAKKAQEYLKLIPDE